MCAVMLIRNPSSLTGMKAEHESEEDMREELEALNQERGRANLPPRQANLDEESLEALGVDAPNGEMLIVAVCRALGDMVATGQMVEILSFGKFVARLFRPATPARLGDNSFVEAPYLGPVEFIASALLQRQVDSGQFDPSLVARCDALFAILREDPRMPRGKIPLLIKGTFRAMTFVLTLHNLVELPGFGFLVVRPRPNRLLIDAAAQQVRTLTGFKSILLRPCPELIARLPGLVVLREPPPRPPPLPLLVNVEPEEEPDE